LQAQGDAVLLFADHYVCVVLFGYVLLAAIADNSIFHLEIPLLRRWGRYLSAFTFSYGVCEFVLFYLKKVIGHPESRLLYDLAYPFGLPGSDRSNSLALYTYYECGS